MPSAGLARYAPLIPNSLTTLRLGIAVAFPLAPHDWRLALVLTGALSDALDGILARRLQAITWLGALLDGIADKVFTLTVLLTITVDGPLSWPQLAGVLARDITNGLIAAYIAAVGRWDLFKRVTARPGGKLTTMAIFAMLVAIVWRPDVGRPLVWVAIATSVVAAVDYAIIFVRWAVWKIEPTHITPSEP